MAKFHTPAINPFTVPQVVGNSSVKSQYLFNNYYAEFTPSYWRNAINNALNYSNLVYLDTLYSWCIQSSPFLQSQIEKRLTPLKKKDFAFKINGKIDKSMTETYTGTRWFKGFIRELLLSKFYGVRVFCIDTKDWEIVDFPLRNIDIFNRGLRNMTYDYYSIVTADKWDNLFYFEPTTDQDFRLGLLQPISRAMIGIVDMYNNWGALAKRYSFPLTVIGYMANNEDAKDIAVSLAQELDPMTIPVVPFRNEYANGGKSLYQVEVNPINTQSYADAFRVFKEYISEYRSEIMQLVTGGTLLGATEKNTNSEELAQIHMNMYRDILDADTESCLAMFNMPATLSKLARIFKDDRFFTAELVEIPNDMISIDTFERAGSVAAKQGMRFKPEVYAKIGMSADDIDTKVNNSSWVSSLTSKVSDMFNKGRKNKESDDKNE